MRFAIVGYTPEGFIVHLIAHSAGSIVHSYIINRLKWNFETVNFMAPAVRTDVFKANVVPAISSGKVKQYNQFELTDEMEQKDPTCKPILGYERSLLYLVSQSFEKGQVTPILGMERYFNSEIASLGLKNMTVYKSPGQYAKSTTHGGFDDDPTTLTEFFHSSKDEGLRDGCAEDPAQPAFGEVERTE